MRANPFESQLERLARTLTEQFGVQVICRGDNPWTDGRRIVLPSLPEPMEDGLERMMVGYLDHEMGHVAFSDFDEAEKFARKYPGYGAILNVVEDALIERRAMARWPGVRANLDAMFRQIRPRVQHLIKKRGPFDRFCTAVYLKLAHYNDLMGLDGELVGYEDLLAQFRHVQKTRDSTALAEAILERWLKNNPLQNSPLPESSSSSGQGSGDGPMGQKQSSQARNQADGGGTSESPGANHNGSERAGQQSQDASGVDDQAGSHTRRRKRTRRGKQSSCAQEGKPGQSKEAADTAPMAGAHTGGRTLIGEALAETISRQVAALDSSCQYRPYTRQYDRIETVPSASPPEVEALLSIGRDTVRRLRRGLTNALRSAEKRWWRDDQVRGALSPRTLYRLCTDRTRLDVFRVRSAVQGRSTAVSVVLDASGSMHTRKMQVARQAVRVLLEALADLKVATEALTFTTGDMLDASRIMHQTGLDAHQLRDRYGRLSNLEIGLVKQFGEPVKPALARLPNVRGSGLTPLGEAMQIAAARLAPRPETRKILLVLTDGKAGCEGSSESATFHAQEVALRICKAGIELIGVGILDDNVCEVISDSIVIQQIEELPAQLCKLLGRTLKKGLKHVG